MDDQKSSFERQSEICTLVSKKRLAELLSVSQRTLQRMLAMEILPPPVHLGRKTIRWKLKVIQEWIDAGCPSCRQMEREK